MGKERAIFPARSPGNDKAGEEFEKQSACRDPARTRPDHSARSAAAGRSQRLSLGSVGGFTSRAGRLAGILSAGELQLRTPNQADSLIGRFVFLLLPG